MALVSQDVVTVDTWDVAAAKVARKAVPNQGLQSIAVDMATCKPFAVDYITQAPALVLAASYGLNNHLYRARQFIIGTFAERIQSRPKLRDLMASYHLAYPFRVLRSTAIMPSACLTVMTISQSKIHPSALAQALPSKPSAQVRFLSVVAQWSVRLMARGRGPSDGLAWAISAAGQAVKIGIPFDLDDVADLYAAGPDNFNLKWTFEQAKAATERWHRHLSKSQNETAFAEKFGIGFSEAVDYRPFPLEADVGWLRFVALNTGEELFADGRAMHHCVGSYAADVIAGVSRIFSIREGDRRLATLEIAFQGPLKRLAGIRQLKGPCNARVPDSITSAAHLFLGRLGERAP